MTTTYPPVLFRRLPDGAALGYSDWPKPPVILTWDMYGNPNGRRRHQVRADYRRKRRTWKATR